MYFGEEKRKQTTKQRSSEKGAPLIFGLLFKILKLPASYLYVRGTSSADGIYSTCQRFKVFICGK